MKTDMIWTKIIGTRIIANIRPNRLFGVTMPEKGISQLVSVDLERAVQLREDE